MHKSDRELAGAQPRTMREALARVGHKELTDVGEDVFCSLGIKFVEQMRCQPASPGADLKNAKRALRAGVLQD